MCHHMRECSDFDEFGIHDYQGSQWYLGDLTVGKALASPSPVLFTL